MSAGAPVGDFRHEALFYERSDDFLAATAGFVREGVRLGEATLVVLEEHKNEALRVVLGDEAADVLFADMAKVGRNPAHIIPAWQRFVERVGAGPKRVRGIGEPISAARGHAELAECERHEALLNLAFKGRAFSLLCPYDTSSLPARVIEGAKQRHEFLNSGSEISLSAGFSGCLGAPLDEPLPVVPFSVKWQEFGASELGVVRRFVGEVARDQGVAANRATEFVIAANEVASNSVRHGGGRGRIALWRDHDRILCEVHDRGRLSNPLVDRTEPAPWSTEGRGLWLANNLCDLVQIRNGDSGTTVRLHLVLT